MTDPSAGAIGAGAAAAVVAVAPAATFMGAPLPMLTAAVTGALFGLAYTKPEAWAKLTEIPAGKPWRRCLWFGFRASGVAFTLLATAFFIVWTLLVAPHYEWTAWLGKGPQEPLAGMFSFIGLRLIPPAIEAGRRIIERRGEGK